MFFRGENAGCLVLDFYNSCTWTTFPRRSLRSKHFQSLHVWKCWFSLFLVDSSHLLAHCKMPIPARPGTGSRLWALNPCLPFGQHQAMPWATPLAPGATSAGSSSRVWEPGALEEDPDVPVSRPHTCLYSWTSVEAKRTLPWPALSCRT